MKIKRSNFKLAILIFVILTVITYFFMYLSEMEDNLNAIKRLKLKEQESLAIYEEILYDELNRSIRDLNYLLATLENNQSCPVEDKFLEFSNSFEVYDQVRFIDFNGMEKARVNYGTEGSYIVADKDLQDKSQRDYFLESMTLKDHEIYLSPVTLNVENGSVEVPYKPVARFLIKSEELGGYIALNYKVNTLFTYLNEYVTHENRALYLVNNDGTYIKKFYGETHYDSLLEGQASFDMSHPLVWAQIDDEIIETDHSLFFSSRIIPQMLSESQTVKNSVPVYLITSVDKSHKHFDFYYDSHLDLIKTIVQKNIYLIFSYLFIAFIVAFFVGNKQYEDQYTNRVLKYIAEFDGDMDRDKYIHSLIKYLAEEFNTKYVFASKVIGKDKLLAQTIALVSQGEFVDNIEYELAHTPCENVFDDKLCTYKSSIQELFPKDKLLVDMEAQSYIGIPLFSSKGKAIGLIAMIDDKPLKDTDIIEKIIKIVAIRAGQDLERILHEAELLRTIDITNNIINATEEGVIVYDEDLNYTIWNAKIAEWTETEPKNVLGKHVLEVFPDLADSDLYKIIENAKAGIYDLGHEYMYVNPSDREIWFRDHTKPLMINNEIKGAIKTLVNITSYKENEKRLEKAIERANSASDAKSRFLANMSHELRTPMNGMLGMIELSLMSDLPEELKGQLEVAQKSGFVLVDILNDILDYSSIESGMAELNVERVDLKSVLKSVIDLHKPLADTKGLKVLIHYDERIPSKVMLDARRLKQVGTNLFGNAVKFTEKGQIDLSIQLIDMNEEDVTLRFSCQDTGIGIAESDIKYIFNRFTQVDSSNVRKYGGVGLGLSIAQNNVRLLGGELKCDSEVRKGTRFSFELTLNYDDDIQDLNIIHDDKVEKVSKDDIHVLIVDDDPVSCRILETFLKRKDYKCFVAHSGLEAIEVFCKEHLDIILMDISMPEMDGIKAMKIIRDNSKDNNEKIIAQTAFAHDDDKKRFLEEGFDDFVSKPINFIHLSKIIDRLLYM